MKESDLIKKIKILKGIEPDQYFSNNLRRLFLISSKKQSPDLPRSFVFNNLKAIFALSLAVIVVFIILIGINFRSIYTPYVASLDKNGINDELSQSDINIYLNEVSYWQENEKQLTSAFGQISNNDSNKETQLIEEVKPDNFKNPKIDELLDSLL